MYIHKAHKGPLPSQTPNLSPAPILFFSNSSLSHLPYIQGLSSTFKIHPHLFPPPPESLSPASPLWSTPTLPLQSTLSTLLRVSNVFPFNQRENQSTHCGHNASHVDFHLPLYLCPLPTPSGTHAVPQTSQALA